MTSFAGSHPVSSEYPEVAHHGMSPMKDNAPPPNEQWIQPQASPTGYQSGLEHAKEGQPYVGPHGAGQAATEKRVGGLKASIFWLIIFLVSLVVIGASVGAGIGACQSQKGGGSCGNAAAAAQSSSPTTTVFSCRSAASTASSTASASPTSTPLPACLGGDGTSYTPRSYLTNSTGAYTYKKVCDTNISGTDLMAAFVTDVNACIGLCSNWNYIRPNDVRCTGAIYSTVQRSDALFNCWIKNSTTTSAQNGYYSGVLAT